MFIFLATFFSVEGKVNDKLGTKYCIVFSKIIPDSYNPFKKLRKS